MLSETLEFIGVTFSKRSGVSAKNTAAPSATIWSCAVLADTTSERIRHIPRVLYHRRALRHSNASAQKWPESPSLGTPVDGQSSTIYSKKGKKARVGRPALLKFYQIEYEPLRHPLPLVSVLVPTTLSTATTAKCLTSVVTRSSYSNFGLLILAHTEHVDTAKRNPEICQLLSQQRVRIVEYREGPFNFSRVNNLGVRSVHGDRFASLMMMSR